MDGKSHILVTCLRMLWNAMKTFIVGGETLQAVINMQTIMHMKLHLDSSFPVDAYKILNSESECSTLVRKRFSSSESLEFSKVQSESARKCRKWKWKPNKKSKNKVQSQRPCSFADVAAECGGATQHYGDVWGCYGTMNTMEYYRVYVV